MTEKPEDSAPDEGAGVEPGPDPPPESTAASENEWGVDHAADIPRSASGGLPIAVIVIAAVIFAAVFYLFRQWRSQYVDYGELGSSGLLTSLGPLIGVG